MKGLELSKCYYHQLGRPFLERQFPDYLDRIAAGLVGEGSECFGFDDEISRDHDFGARFCIWLPSDVFWEVGMVMRQAYKRLVEETVTFLGEPVAVEHAVGGAQRSGVFSIEGFYTGLLGHVPLPEKEEDWFMFRESALAAATNGEVFEDQAGIFTKVRQGFQAYYPENVRLKKLAQALAYMAQTGQVNYARCMWRGDVFTAGICVNEFIRAAFSALFLLNRRYMPYYKWAFRALENATTLLKIREELRELQMSGGQQETWKSELTIQKQTLKGKDHKLRLIEQICTEMAEELRAQGLSDLKEDFLLPHALQVHKRITNETVIRIPLRMPEWMG